MARTQVERSLPSITSTFRMFQGFNSSTSRQAALLKELRSAAKKLRLKDARPFFSMRDVGAHFEVPLRTVAIAYEQLELEGLLNRIRGSKTMLMGKALSPRKPVRALIGIPLWLHAVVVSPYSRLLHVELEDRLRRCGFVADIIFFRGNEVASPEFANRLLQHNLDYILWHTPHPSASQVILSLKDSGVRQIIIQPADNPISRALPTYFQDWQAAYKLMATDWRKHAIKTVLLSEPIYLPSKKAMKSFEATLRSEGIDMRIVAGTADQLRRTALSLSGSSTVVAFLDQLGADTICNEEPVLIAQILKHCRVAFCRGPLRVPYFQHRNVCADLVRFSAPEIAEKVVRDIQDGKILAGGHMHTFQAHYEPQVPFASTESL